MVPMFKCVLTSVIAEIPIVHIKHIFIDILIAKELGAWEPGKIKGNAYIRKFISLGFLLHCSIKERTKGLECENPEFETQPCLLLLILFTLWN